MTEVFPKIGMGTFGSDRYDGATVSAAVAEALRAGYRLLDCASVYGNEKEIGDVFASAFADGIVRREDVTVMSKVWNDCHGEGRIAESCKQSLSDLGLEYLDAYFMHWPFPNYHARGCGGDSRNPDSRPFFAEEFSKAWRQMEELKRGGSDPDVSEDPEDASVKEEDTKSRDCGGEEGGGDDGPA